MEGDEAMAENKSGTDESAGKLLSAVSYLWTVHVSSITVTLKIRKTKSGIWHTGRDHRGSVSR